MLPWIANHQYNLVISLKHDLKISQDGEKTVTCYLLNKSSLVNEIHINGEEEWGPDMRGDVEHVDNLSFWHSLSGQEDNTGHLIYREPRLINTKIKTTTLRIKKKFTFDWMTAFSTETTWQYLFYQVSFVATFFVIILQSLQDFFKQLINTEKFQLMRKIAIKACMLLNVN